MEEIACAVCCIVIVVVIRLLAGSRDGNRVRRYIRSQGGKVLQSHWHPFGRGWFGEKNARIYAIRYQDAVGNIHKATVKTSVFAGVYLTEDTIIKSVVVNPERERNLASENARLQQRLAQLAQTGGPNDG